MENFTFDSPYQQQFPFLRSYVNYITDISSYDLYEKLIQQCKWFFAVKKVLVVNDFEMVEFKNPTYSWFENLKNKKFSLPSRSDIDLSTKKLWLTGKFHVACFQRYHAFSDLAKLIYRCNITSLKIPAGAMLTVDEFLLLIKDVTKIYLSHFWFRDGYGMKLHLNDILQLLPNIKKFR